eukprot:TRINITY_DN863_c0_g1_i1.p1 TRINITY_DN863_c0_g1~~TRINITY_DN863_c0_g1_i1.p1  ORF type:complete len:436 (+),score=253.82 TRINITY_DN863_c0_g1_i1:46-1353(+)
MFSRCLKSFKTPSNSSLVKNFKRNLNIHEYQSQNLMRKYGITVIEGDVATTPAQAKEIAKRFPNQDVVIKAQVHAGGRGKGTFLNGFKGGVHMCSSPEEAEEIASKMLGQRLVTKQSGPEGKPVNSVYVVRRFFIRRETYLAILMDRASNGPAIIGSAQGGMDIETLAIEDPNAIIKMPVDIHSGVSPSSALSFALKLGFKGEQAEKAAKEVLNLYSLFVKTDATMIEVNPFCESSDGTVLCADAKINFDDNAAYRQTEVFQMNDIDQMDPRDAAAAKFDLNFIALDGDIGCLVNGAGLAMATMDIIKLAGGNPANFLDVGGGATERQVTEALKIIASDPKVNAILVNIFGGIMRCDIIAHGLIAAVNNLNLSIPLVVRLEGTNVLLAKEILRESGLRIIPAEDLDDAASKAVNISNIVKMAKGAHLNVHFQLPL